LPAFSGIIKEPLISDGNYTSIIIQTEIEAAISREY
jgi:hypothetical protein